MNVLPVLVDLSPSIKPDAGAAGRGTSVDGFASMLDHALSSPASISAPSESTASRAEQKTPPYESPNAPQRSGENAPKQSHQSDHATTSKTENAHHPAGGKKEHADRAGAPQAPAKGHPHKKTSPKEPDGKTAVAKRPVHEEPASPAAVQKPQKGEPATKGHAPRTPDLKKLVPFPGAIVLAGTKKPVASAPERVVARTPSKAKNTTTSEPVALPVALAKPAQETTAEPPAAKGAAAKGGATKDRKAKDTQDAATKAAQLAAQASAPPLPSPGGTVQQVAAAQPAQPANHAAHSPAGQAPQQVSTTGTPALTVIDLRQNSQNANSGTSNPHGGQSQGGEAFRLFQVADGAANAPSPSNAQAFGVRAGGVPLPSQAFSALTDHIVKQTGILLKDNNSGEIRLVLKPENLGQLRIKIDMVNNNLTGKIFVQNHDAMRLVQQNLDNLYRALRDSGFTATQLNVSVGGREHHERGRERSSPLPLLRAVEGVRGFDSQTPAAETMGGAHSLVNLVI